MGGGGSSGYEWSTFVRVSLHLELRSQKALEKTVSFPQLAMLSTRCFSLEQETLRHSHYLVSLIFYEERMTSLHYNKLSFMFS